MKYEYSKVTSSFFPELTELQEEAVSLLKGFGCKDDDILFEYKVADFRVDVVGLLGDSKIAVELGLCTPWKLFALKHYFDRVVWLPYWFTKIEADDNEKIRLNNRIGELEDLNKTLQKQVKNFKAWQRMIAEHMMKLLDYDDVHSLCRSVFGFCEGNNPHPELK